MIIRITMEKLSVKSAKIIILILGHNMWSFNIFKSHAAFMFAQLFLLILDLNFVYESLCKILV